MLLEMILVGVILLVLYGLINSTETVLSARDTYVVLDERMTDHRSRL